MKKLREKVLVFEDKDYQFGLLRNALQGEGYQVVWAKSPAEFRRHAPYNDFVFVLIDFFFGDGPDAEKAGIELPRSVKEKNPSVPVIVVSVEEPDRNEVAEAF